MKQKEPRTSSDTADAQDSGTDVRRRDAVRQLVGAGFALPVMVSIAVSALPIRAAHAQSMTMQTPG